MSQGCGITGGAAAQWGGDVALPFLALKSPFSCAPILAAPRLPHTWQGKLLMGLRRQELGTREKSHIREEFWNRNSRKYTATAPGRSNIAASRNRCHLPGYSLQFQLPLRKNPCKQRINRPWNRLYHAVENDKISVSEQMEKVKPAYLTEKTSYRIYGLHNAE